MKLSIEPSDDDEAHCDLVDQLADRFFAIAIEMPGVTLPAIFEAATVIIGRAMTEVPPEMRARIREAVTIGVEEAIDCQHGN